jgi:hypothetical protein
MDRATPVWGPQGQFRSNSFGLCRCTPPAGNSFAFYRCEIASHLHILQPFKITRLHGLAQKRRWGEGAILHLQRQMRSTSPFSPYTSQRSRITIHTIIVSNILHTPMRSRKTQLVHFQAITHSGGEGGRYSLFKGKSLLGCPCKLSIFKRLRNIPSCKAPVLSRLRNFRGRGRFRSKGTDQSALLGPSGGKT